MSALVLASDQRKTHCHIAWCLYAAASFWSSSAWAAHHWTFLRFYSNCVNIELELAKKNSSDLDGTETINDYIKAEIIFFRMFSV